jgi:hypothetical protein
MSYLQRTWKLVVVLLFLLTLYGCHQPKLHVVGDEPTRKFTSASQELSLQSGQRQEETTTGGHAPSVIVLTSSSDTSPDAKNSNILVACPGSSPGLLSVAVEQDGHLNTGNTDTMTPQKSELTKKCSNPAQFSVRDVTSPVFKKSKKILPLSHREWFQAFFEAIKLIEQDTT